MLNFLRPLRRIAATTALFATCLSVGGCAEVTMASFGVMAGIAATALSTTTDVYRLGKLDSADPIPFEAWTQATRQACLDLGLAFVSDQEQQPGVWHMLLRDERQKNIRIRIERHTEYITRTRIDVGLFGSEPTARLLIDQIRRGAMAASSGSTRGPVWGWGSVPGLMLDPSQVPVPAG